MHSAFSLFALLSGIFACGVAVTLVALRRAPDGYEDGEGFHAVRTAKVAATPDCSMPSHSGGGLGAAA